MYHNYDLKNIKTPVNVYQLEMLLKNYQYDQLKTEFLINGFTNGFDLGYRGDRKVKRVAPNLKFRVGDEIELWNKVMAEVKLGRYAGPYNDPPFEFFVQSPIGLVPKDNGAKTRLIFHLSYPHTKLGNKPKSINANTPNSWTKVKYMDFDQAVLLCRKAGKGCYAGKSDLSSAFRHLAIRKLDWMLLVMKARNPVTQKFCYFVDKCLPFGAAISCALFQAFSDAVAFIVSRKTNKKLVNYLDDFFFVALLRMLCNSQITEFMQVCELINFPVSQEKTFWGNTQIVFLGLLINTMTCTVSIPVDKINKALKLIAFFLTRRKAKLIEVQQLCGLLNFFTRAIVPGRAFMRRLYNNTKGVQRAEHYVRICKQFKADLKLWQVFLLHPTAYARPFIDFETIQQAKQVEVYSDASRNSLLGCGGHNGKSWFVKRWDQSFILEFQPSIAYLELYALTVGMHLWVEQFANNRIIIFCDNLSVVYMVNTQTSSCKKCMTLIRLLVLQQLLHNVRIFARHVPTELNVLSDSLSRGQWKRFAKNAARSYPSMDKQPMPIPQYLSDMRYLYKYSSI